MQHLLPDLLNVPMYVTVIFVLTTLFTLVQFYRIIRQSPSFGSKANLIMGGILVWILLQFILTENQFYITNITSIPPRFILAVVPTLIALAIVFMTKDGRAFADSLSLEEITWLNIVRIPVEFCLYWLFLAKAIPELMTFAGRNFDILPGLTAPFIAYFGFRKKQLNRSILLAWNIISLGFLLFIIVNAILSSPIAFQVFAFDQPNIAVMYFPFILLPAVIVPIVLFGHFASIRRLVMQTNDNRNMVSTV